MRPGYVWPPGAPVRVCANACLAMCMQRIVFRCVMCFVGKLVCASTRRRSSRAFAFVNERVACEVRVPGVCVAAGCSRTCLCERRRDVSERSCLPLRNVFRWKTKCVPARRRSSRAFAFVNERVACGARCCVPRRGSRHVCDGESCRQPATVSDRDLCVCPWMESTWCMTLHRRSIVRVECYW